MYMLFTTYALDGETIELSLTCGNSELDGNDKMTNRMNKKFRVIRHLLIVLGVLFSSLVFADKATTDARISKLLAAMTIEQKVGQMTQVNLGVIIDKKVNDHVQFDPDKLDLALRKYQVGSILNSTSRALTIEEWHEVIRVIQDKALKNDLSIPVIYGIDAIHGVTYTKGSTLFPHNIGMAATRNPGLVMRMAKATAMEARASGLRWNFDPVLDVGRNPIWPRFSETFGEDSYLGTVMGVATINGYEEDGLDSVTAVASCMKHYVGYSDPANGKDRTPAYIPDVVLWEHHLPQFKAAVEAGASTIMINSASINGMPVHASKYLLTDVLRGQFGFEGVIVSDWEDVIRIHTRHRVAESPREAVKMAVDAGLDMSMVPHNFSFADLLIDLVKGGEISNERIDQSVARILRLKMDLGLFENPYAEEEAVKNFGLPAYKELALDAARESITLLKNQESILPLPSTAKVLLAGPAALNLGPLHGSWSYSWQGNVKKNYPETTLNIYEAFVGKLGSEKVVPLAKEGFENAGNYDAESLQKLAKDVDYIVLALGERAYAESPGALDDLNLPEDQKALARAAAATGKPVILVLTEGRPRIIRDIEPLMNGIVLAYQPASQGARAITDVLFGDFNPAGVLPFSYPRYTGDIMPYNHGVLADIQQLSPSVITYGGYKPQWPFGHGLSYTTFEYSGLKLSKSVVKNGEVLEVSLLVSNTGDRSGQHSIDLYISDLYASLSPAVRKLRRFTKTHIEAGESKTITFELDNSDLSFVNAELQRVVEPGEFMISVGELTETFRFE
jgi:beta-glucosidase